MRIAYLSSNWRSVKMQEVYLINQQNLEHENQDNLEIRLALIEAIARTVDPLHYYSDGLLQKDAVKFNALLSREHIGEALEIAGGNFSHSTRSYFLLADLFSKLKRQGHNIQFVGFQDELYIDADLSTKLVEPILTINECTKELKKSRSIETVSNMMDESMKNLKETLRMLIAETDQSSVITRALITDKHPHNLLVMHKTEFSGCSDLLRVHQLYLRQEEKMYVVKASYPTQFEEQFLLLPPKTTAGTQVRYEFDYREV